ncbi:MAG: adenylosuccinate lyase [Flavobacteriaceae bacterium]|nr:adenylosuccinate lyase [Flavobacteriaceae bacterium]
MSTHYLIDILNNMSVPTRENRQYVANIVYNNQELFKYLVEITFEVENKQSIKAAWVLEWICSHGKLTWIIPHLDTFTQSIGTVHFGSAIRPCAKICELIAVAYTSKKENPFQRHLTIKHIDAMVETGFDWLITPQKIAVRAYTMHTLYLFGLQKEWIHPELEHIISTKIIKESKGCKARGTKILGLIKKR